MNQNLNRTLFAAVLLLAVAVPTWASGGTGMSWGKASHDATTGTDQIGCMGCDPYVGNTACSTALPVMCFKADGSPAPGSLVLDYYHGWKGGHIATTPPIAGTSLGSAANANLICTSYFGAGWGIAEFHHSLGGWYWSAYGDVRTDLRSWVYINDTTGNCWN